MSAVDRDVRRGTLATFVVSDYPVFKAPQEAVRDVQRASGDVSAAHSKRVSVVAEEAYVFFLGGAITFCSAMMSVLSAARCRCV